MLLWILLSLSGKALVKGREAVLLDTRTATSDLGWTKSPDSKWQDGSSAHPEGNDRRILMVCEIMSPKQNNWIRSPYIPVGGVQRVYVEFEFTMRSCEDVENVATCKETFNLFYYQTDRDEATTTFPPWNGHAYTKVDTVAADKRFNSGTNETNFETRDIGPLTRNGIYLAIQDTGACIAIMHVRVFYKYCPPIGQNLAHFSRTNAGPERTSLIERIGICVKNALDEKNSVAALYCNSDGEWDVPKGRCLCEPGYSPSPDRKSCQECGRGLYKANIGNGPCLRCPSYSHSNRNAASICECMNGYFRALSDSAASTCSKPPGSPRNLQATTNNTRISLSWDRPLNDGGRGDLSYRIECLECRKSFTNCSICPASLLYFPAQTHLHVTRVKVQNVKKFAFYKFIVYAENGVTETSQGSKTEINHAFVTVATSETRLPPISKVFVSNVAATSFTVSWVSIDNRLHLNYEVVVGDLYKTETARKLKTFDTQIEIEQLTPNRNYIVKVRAQNGGNFGPFSPSRNVKTSLTESPPLKPDIPLNPLHIVIGVVAGVVCIILLIIVASFCRRRSKNYPCKGAIEFEKYPMLNTNTLLSNGREFTSLKTYIDPTVYQDPRRALLDFAKELNASCVSIDTTIGGGEFGDVCRGHMTSATSDKKYDVAIKTLKVGSSPDQKLDFLAEASIMGQFDHPNVIRLEGVVTKSRPLMIITEFMENGSLDNFLRKHDGELNVLALVGMLRHIAAGMKYLAEMGYVHRDLAARNVLVDAKMVCKVSDFGLSRVLEEDNDDDATYTTSGGKIPIRWTAPEAIVYRKFTSASDVWSFGIVMWEVMSYGERPYWGMSNRDVISAVENGFRLPAPMDCPVVQHQLMLECWRKNRNERPKFTSLLTSLDRMLRDPSQLKITATPGDHNGHLVTGGGSLARLPSHFKSKPSHHRVLGAQSTIDVSGAVYQPSSENLGSINTWLDSVGLGQYAENFKRCGYSALEQLLLLKSSDFPELGVKDLQHQRALFEAIYPLKSNSLILKRSLAKLDDSLAGIPV